MHQVLAVRERYMGDTLPTATSRYNLAVVAWRDDQLDVSLDLVTLAVNTRMQVLGPTNPGTANALSLMGEVHMKLKQPSKATEIFKVRSGDYGGAGQEKWQMGVVHFGENRMGA